MRRAQQGIALIALLAILGIGASWYLVSSLSQAAQRTAFERSHNARLLLQAKQALLGWVAQNALPVAEVNPGKLPCPEALGNFQVPPAANEGVMQGFCGGAATAVGRLPWRSLGLDKPYDASGEVLWYVVSPGWKRPDNTNPEVLLGLNSNSPGQLALDGQPNAVVAAIIAPGRPVQLAPNVNQQAQGCVPRTQTRTVFPPADSQNYLECQNIAGAALRASVVDNASNPVFNDQLVTITAAEVMAAIEGVIAARIQRDVLPTLQAAIAYTSAEWGASAAMPIVPFAAPFVDPGTGGFNLSFEGAAGTTQGLLPLVASTCSAVNAAFCDPSFVSWNTATIVVTPLGGTSALASNCAASTTAQIECMVTYSRTCVGIFTICTATLTGVRVDATARNAGMALRVQTTAPVTGLPAPLAMTAPLNAAGSAAAQITGGAHPDVSCLTVVTCTASATFTLRIPIGVFADHPFLAPVRGVDAWFWFLANNWHHVTYYAAAASHVPSGPVHNCQAQADCIRITNGNPAANIRATIAFAGRSLSAMARPNANLNDFLDGAVNQTLDRDFEQKRIDRSFNDRFFVLGNY